MKNCKFCQEPFETPLSYKLYCSLKCRRKSNEINKPKNRICLNCSKATSNPKFCCQSCACSFSNRTSPRRRIFKQRNCERCFKDLTGYRRRFCVECSIPPDLTLKDAIYTKHYRSAAFALVRYRARAILLKLGWTTCCNCSYIKHFEACHIKPIKSFSDDTLLSVINNPDNLLPLCPNCHWELDHGSLKLQDIKNRPKTPVERVELSCSILEESNPHPEEPAK
jgi:hypothetical protein